jgi:N-acyl-D-amino-acid deacylase
MPEPTVIAGGLVVDGTGVSAAQADVWIADGRVTDVQPAADYHAGATVIDAQGLVVAPGFIDVHSHADNAPLLPEPDLTKLRQGVTTEVVGNCGFSLAPRLASRREQFAAFLQRLFPPARWEGERLSDLLAETDRRGYVTNYAPLVGHGTLRLMAMGMEAREPTATELREMGRLLRQALEEGAFGLSSGLIYPPGLFSRTDELIELAGHLSPHHLYTSHIRGEGAHLEESVAEAIRIGREAGCRVQISHHKAAGRPHWGKTRTTLAMLAEARARGVEVDQDVYPYTAASTMLAACLPPAFLDVPEPDVLRRLEDPDWRDRLRRALAEGVPGWENHVGDCGWDGILISSTASHQFEGRTLAEVAGDLGVEPLEALVRVLVRERLRASMVIFSMDEADVTRVLADPRTMVGSDGLPPGFGGRPHPRLFGTFPRVLARYVRELGLLSLEEAVRKMTWQPAQKFRIPERGRVAPGLIADLVAFDRDRIQDHCDYRDPGRPPDGIAWVMQAGQVALEQGRFLGERLGRRLEPASGGIGQE